VAGHDSRGQDSIEVDSTKVGRFMEARLTGTGFAITAGSPESQVVSTGQPTTWEWQIKALSEGIQYLHLSLDAHFKIQDEDAVRELETFDRDIAVEVSPLARVSSFLTQNWQWVWAALLVPGVPWLFHLRRRHARRKSK